MEPEESAVLRGGLPGTHKIQGIGAGFAPSILNASSIDELISIHSDEAMVVSKRMAFEEGLLCGMFQLL